MNSNTPKIFISYSHKDIRVVNQIDLDFQSIGITLTRDTRDVSYKGSIVDHMKNITKHDYVLVIISDHFLKSSNCMYEMLELMELESFEDKILPILIETADIFKSEGQITYLKFWEQKIAELNRDTKSLQELTGVDSIVHSLALYRLIRQSMDKFLSYLKNHLIHFYTEVKKEQYKSILDFVKFQESEVLAESFWIMKIADQQEQEIQLENLLEKYPNNKHLELRKAYLQNQRGHFKLARYSYEKLIKKHPDYAFAQNNYAKLLFERFDERENALRHYLIAIDIDNEYYNAYNNLAVLFTDKSEFEKADEQLRYAIKLNPNLHLAYYNLAHVQCKGFKNYSEARKQLENAIELNPEYSPAYFFLSDLIKEHFNEPELAKKYYFRAKWLEVTVKDSDQDSVGGGGGTGLIGAEDYRDE